MRTIHLTDMIENGTCGKNLHWNLTEDGTLTIGGTGNMQSDAAALWNTCAEQVRVLVLEEGVHYVSASAFTGCTHLRTVTIRSNGIRIGERAFRGLPALTEVLFENNTDTAVFIDAEAFTGCVSLQTVRFPASLRRIGPKAFANCTSLTSLYLPDALEHIGAYAFSGCSSVRFLRFGEQVTNLGTGAFSGCTGLPAVRLPGSLTELKDLTFADCPELISVILPESLTRIGALAFDRCPGLLRSAWMKSHVTVAEPAYRCGDKMTCFIDTNAVLHFRGKGAMWSRSDWQNESGTSDVLLSRVRAVVFEGNITSVGTGAFSGMTMPSLTLPESVTTVREAAFRDSRIPRIVLPDGLIRIGRSAFEGSLLRSIRLPDSVKDLGEKAFRGCAELRIVRMDTSAVEILHERTFEKCTALTSVTLPRGLRRIDPFVFRDCGSLEQIAVPDAVLLDNYAFFNCMKLRTVVLPNSVRAARFAFMCCPSLELPEATKNRLLNSFRREKYPRPSISLEQLFAYDLDLADSTVGALNDAGIRFVSDLMKMTREEVAALPGIGYFDMVDIEGLFQEMKLSFR